MRKDATAAGRTAAALAAVEETQPTLNAFVHTLAEDALARAAELDATDQKGPLHGMPVAVKDLIDVAGSPTTGGCAAYRDRVAERDAPVVAKLRAAGAVPVVKTNVHELGAGATGLVSCFGPTRNPWDLERITGGSSSGSAAAVAAGVVPLALGSDSGGSIRIPASFCGVTGLKPTPGRVALAGALPMSRGFDTIGPLARDAHLCAAAFAAITADRLRPVPDDPTDGLRVGLPEPFFALLHPDTERCLREAASCLEELGALIQPLDSPGLDEGGAGFKQIWHDLAHHHRSLVGNPEVSPEVAALLDLGWKMGDEEVTSSRRRASETRAAFLAALRAVDVLLVPATPCPAPRAIDDDVAVQGGRIDVHRGGPSRFTYVVNEAGLPAVTFPVGHSVDGLPVGAQLIGRPHADEHLLGVAAAYQRRTPHHERRPPLHVGRGAQDADPSASRAGRGLTAAE